MLGITPEPWTPADSVVWGKLMGLQLSHNYKLEMLRAQLAPKLTASQMNARVSARPATRQLQSRRIVCAKIEGEDRS